MLLLELHGREIAKRGFRKLVGYQAMPILVAALRALMILRSSANPSLTLPRKPVN